MPEHEKLEPSSPLDDHGIRERIIRAAEDGVVMNCNLGDVSREIREDIAVSVARAALLAVRDELDKKQVSTWVLNVVDTLLASLDPQETNVQGTACPDCVKGLQPSTYLDDEQPMRLCSTCDGGGLVDPHDEEQA